MHYRPSCLRSLARIMGLLLSLQIAHGAVLSEYRSALSLNGEWQFRQDSAKTNDWKTVQVPSVFQDHEGNDFHGVGWYRRKIPDLAIPAGARILLHFQAAATDLEVWWNGQRLGRHLGGWTPFRMDVTDQIRKSPAESPHELLVRLDEAVGHNTQGFLPVIAPHFGGLWQEVKLIVVPETYLDDLRLEAWGDMEDAKIKLQCPVQGLDSNRGGQAVLRYRLQGEPVWTNHLARLLPDTNNLVRVEIPLAGILPWSPESPRLYEVEWRLLPNSTNDAGADCISTRAAFRTIKAMGNHFNINGRPASLRGVLNWGYYPPRLAPFLDEKRFQRDLDFAKSCGFNLMKFCLWVPPKRFLEMADEMGLFTWVEYPTWHARLTRDFRDALRQEFTEFFQHDRNHPSVILRSLTCEAGSSAQLPIIQELYDLAHQLIPNALVEDDSSWIGWNRVHDFYDDHPYGNNHTWKKNLYEFGDYILSHGPKPIILGEAIAADTWVNRESLLKQVGENRPYWVPAVLDEIPTWQKKIARLNGAEALAHLEDDSLEYALAMRKFQIEVFRRELPYGGYVVSVLRDFPLASMGLLDYQDQPKWPALDWGWHKETMCLLETETDRRSYFSQETLAADVWLSHFGSAKLSGADLSLLVLNSDPLLTPIQNMVRGDIEQNPGTLARLASLSFALPEVTQPRKFWIQALVKSGSFSTSNQWPVWVFPQPQPHAVPWLHHSLPEPLGREVFPHGVRNENPTTGQVAIATRMDEQLVSFVEQGGNLLWLPDGQPNSLPLNAHWFLRGAPCLSTIHPLAAKVPRSLWVDLQHFDLAGDVVPNLEYLEQTNPLLTLWDTHDQKTVKTHGLVYELKAGKGHILVSALRHAGDKNAAGKWLAQVFEDYLAAQPAGTNVLSETAWQHLKEKLHEEKIDLSQQTWLFKPDSQDEGLAQSWFAPGLPENTGWKPIRIGGTWQSQGQAGVRGRAWYRLRIKLPDNWDRLNIYLGFEGVLDTYELYVNGHFAGQGGNLATRKTAAEERKSYRINPWLQNQRECVIAIRVCNWAAAGGITRPITLSTAGFMPGEEILKE